MDRFGSDQIIDHKSPHPLEQRADSHNKLYVGEIAQTGLRSCFQL